MPRTLPNPFFGPVLVGEHGAVLYKQGRDYKAEDALALIELARAISPEYWERVEFFPIEPQAQLMFKVGELLKEFGSYHPGIDPLDRDVDEQWARIAENFDAMVTNKNWYPRDRMQRELYRAVRRYCVDYMVRYQAAHSRRLFELTDAINILIIGRPQYFACWWLPTSIQGVTWPMGWFKELVKRSGYGARYVIPFDAHQPFYSYGVGDALYDRKWGAKLSRVDNVAATATRPDEEIDYALVFNNRVEINGITRRVTICTGLGALGTWAAVRFAADPAFFGQLNGLADVDDREGPLEVALRIRMDHRPLPTPLGPHRLGLNNIEILNNDPSEYLGQVHLPSGEHASSRSTVYWCVNEAVRGHRKLDLGHPIRALCLLVGGDRTKLADLDITATMSIDEESDRDPDAFVERNTWDGLTLPASWKDTRPRFTVSAAGDVHTIRVDSAIVTWPGENKTHELCLGPHLHTVLWHLLDCLPKAAVATPPTPILLLGDSGSGKDPLMESVRRAWWYIANGRTLTPGFSHSNAVLNAAEEGDELNDRLKTSLTQFINAQGSLFVDEFAADLSHKGQASLLRLLQDGNLGANRVHRALVVAATSRPIRQMIGAGKFLEDLLYRFHVVTLPPLRRRPSDAAVLLAYRWQKETETELNITVPALKLFLSSSFEGNVRVLLNDTLRALLGLYNRRATQASDRIDFALMCEALGIGEAAATEVARTNPGFESTSMRFEFGRKVDLHRLVEAVRFPGQRRSQKRVTDGSSRGRRGRNPVDPRRPKRARR